MRFLSFLHRRDRHVNEIYLPFWHDQDRAAWDFCDTGLSSVMTETARNRFVPASSARTHMFLASIMWTAVGFGMSTFGLITTLRYDEGDFTWYPYLLIISVAIGILKARFMLSKAVDRITERIRRRGNDKCIVGFISWQMWILVIIMMTVGKLVRSQADVTIPHQVVGLIYVAIGCALFLASIRSWIAWHTLDIDNKDTTQACSTEQACPPVE